MIYILFAMIFYTAAIMFGAAASRAINSNLVAAIVNTISAVIPVVTIFFLSNKRIGENGKFGIFMSILGGLSVALFVMAINKGFQINKVALVSPLVFGGAIFLSAILSFFIFKEKLSALPITGLCVLGIGLVIIIYSAATSK